MDFFRRKAVAVDTKPVSSIYQAITDRKIAITNRTAVCRVLHTWEAAGLWQWKLSSRSKSPLGIPVGLYNGIHYIDKLLMGKPLSDSPVYESQELYGPYVGKLWRTNEICTAIQEYAKAATNSEYMPVSPADKAKLQKRTLADFFYAEYIDAKPTAYIHAPFLYFFTHGAEPVIISVSLKTPTNKYLFDKVCNHFTSIYGGVLSTTEKNRVVIFTDTLFHWYTNNNMKLSPNDRRLDYIFELWADYLRTWKVQPQSIVPTVGKAATENILSKLQKSATYIELKQEVITQESQSCEILPTSILSDIASDGNYLGVLAAYCEAHDLQFDPQTVDVIRLAAYGYMQVRQAVRQYRLGAFTKTSPKKRNWREVLQQYER